MTQGISLYNQKNELIYHTTHARNGDYLERETERSRFKILSGIDDCDPSNFGSDNIIIQLIHELDIVIGEAEAKADTELANHLKEILVLCRLCLWSTEKFNLVISPFEYVPRDSIPKSMPEKFLHNISNVGN